MKKIKNIIFLLLFLVSVFSLTACSFVSYVKDNSASDALVEKSEIENLKNDYIYKLNNASSDDLYREEERKLFISYIIEAKSEIMESNSREDIIFIYDKYLELINGLKTDKEYSEEEAISALTQYKSENIKLISNWVDIDLYREQEKESINSMLNKYIEDINNTTDTKMVDDLVVDYKISVYEFKTDEELYQEELNLLIKNSINEIKNYKNLSNYRNNEKLVINQMIDSFNQQVAMVDNKESVNKLVVSYKAILDSIKTDAELYEEERLALVDECFQEMLTLVNLDTMTDESKANYLSYCDKVKNEMLTISTKESITSRLLQEKQKLYQIGAQNGDEDSLTEYQIIVTEDLDNYLDNSLYREEQQDEIKQIIKQQGRKIRTQNSYDDTILVIEETHTLLDAVLTNDEMWVNEDEQFFVNLHSLYGDDILIPPSSLIEANDYYELAKIIDYYAFYQIDGNSFVRDIFRVKCNFENDKNANYIKNEVYWYCELINGAVGIEAYSEMGYIVFRLIPYNIATISNVESTIKIDKYNWGCDFISNAIETRNNDYDDFAYYKNVNRCIVSTSQQLWYALENNYIPIPVENSRAELLLNTAKNILNKIIKNDMTDQEKIYRIFEWISDNIQYDFKAYSYNNSSNMDLYPDENYSRLNSLHLEGGLLDGTCVCSGYAKTYLLLLKIEGIDAKRVIARASRLAGINTINSRDYGGGGFGFHEFVFINIDGKWYYSDAERSCLENNNSIHSYIYLMLSPYQQNYGFVTFKTDLELADTFYKDIYDSITYNKASVNEDIFNCIKKFSESNVSKSQISFVVNSQEREIIISYIINYLFNIDIIY